jgi:hypothetical protein
VVVDEAIGQVREALREATSAEGPLGEADLQRIRKRGADAPNATRKAIDDAVATSGSGSGGTQETGGTQNGSGGVTGTGGNSPKRGPEDDGGDATNGSQDAGQGSDPVSSSGASGEASGTATGR